MLPLKCNQKIIFQNYLYGIFFITGCIFCKYLFICLILAAKFYMWCSSKNITLNFEALCELNGTCQVYESNPFLKLYNFERVGEVGLIYFGKPFRIQVPINYQSLVSFGGVDIIMHNNTNINVEVSKVHSYF